MTLRVARAGFLIAAFAAIAMVTVHLRAEQARCEASIAGLDAQCTVLRRDWWDLQVRAARLRAPGRIRHHAQRFHADLVSPEFDILIRGTARLASDRIE